MPTTGRRALAGITVSAVALTASALFAPSASAEPEPDLWACLPEERAAMGVGAGEDCYLTGEQLDQAGWFEVPADQPSWCWPNEDAPEWVLDAQSGMC